MNFYFIFIKYMYCDASINGMAAHVPTHIYRHDMTTIMIMVVMGRPAHLSTLASIAIARCKVIRSLGNCMHVYIYTFDNTICSSDRKEKYA